MCQTTTITGYIPRPSPATLSRMSDDTALSWHRNARNDLLHRLITLGLVVWLVCSLGDIWCLKPQQDFLPLHPLALVLLLLLSLAGFVTQLYRLCGLMIPASMTVLVCLAIAAFQGSTSLFTMPKLLQELLVGAVMVLAGLSVQLVCQVVLDRKARAVSHKLLLWFLVYCVVRFAVLVTLGCLILFGSPAGLMTAGSKLVEWISIIAHIEVVFITVCLVVWTTLHHTRGLFELVVEWCVRPWLYRVRWTGPGTNTVPIVGPCLVISNHGSWPDPVFLGMALPRPMTAIMTQRFYDIWFLQPILKYIFRAIVVPEKPIRRETPELEQAVAALQRGEMVVIYPEGYLRRKEEQPLKRFGQGVWRILQACPDTPVVPCWIEGVWGSKFSHAGGPPGAKNKKMDFFRRISIRMMPPLVVPPEVLAEGMATRLYLMNRVIDAHNSGATTPLPHVTAASGESTEA
jgi:1-acyl-sn-glycerol-3-phosphate acyltransferase